MLEIVNFEDLGKQKNGDYLSRFTLSDGRVIENEFYGQIHSQGLFSAPVARLQSDEAALCKAAGIDKDYLRDWMVARLERTRA